MGDKKVWLVTGAGRGLGVDIARAALAAGHAVVATGRNTEKVSSAIGEHNDLMAVKLDVTGPADAEAAVAAAVDRFGRVRGPLGQQRLQDARRGALPDGDASGHADDVRDLGAGAEERVARGVEASAWRRHTGSAAASGADRPARPVAA